MWDTTTWSLETVIRILRNHNRLLRLHGRTESSESTLVHRCCKCDSKRPLSKEDTKWGVGYDTQSILEQLSQASLTSLVVAIIY